MKIATPFDPINLNVQDAIFMTYFSIFVQQVTDVVNGQLTFKENFNLKIVNQFFSVANIDQAVIHNLNRIPLGYIQIGALGAAQLYNGTLSNTSQVIYVRSTVATTVTLLII